MLWLPVESVLVVKVAWSVLAPLSVPLPIRAERSRKLTVTVGFATALLPGLTMATVAVKVTAWPLTVAPEDATMVLVLALLTACVMAALALGLKLASSA